MNIEQARFNMIEQQIRPWNVLDPAILELLSEVKREDFLPPALRPLAFADLELKLELSGGDSVTTLPPRVEARIVQDVIPKQGEKVLLVGARSGYLAALLGKMAERVIAYELRPELAQMSRDNLQKAGIGNVEVREGDGSKGAAADAPFDVIVLAGSVSEAPHALLEQLAQGGRLFAVIGSEQDGPVMRATVITRTGDATYSSSQGWDTVLPRLRNFPEASKFQF